MSEPIKRRVMRIEFRGPNDAGMILDDGSELVGLTFVKAECTGGAIELMGWEAKGYVFKAGKPHGEANP